MKIISLLSGLHLCLCSLLARHAPRTTKPARRTIRHAPRTTMHATRTISYFAPWQSKTSDQLHNAKKECQILKDGEYHWIWSTTSKFIKAETEKCYTSCYWNKIQHLIKEHESVKELIVTSSCACASQIVSW